MIVRGGTRLVYSGHTLVEMVVAMACSVVLLAGLGSVMFIGAQVAYTPSAAVHRIDAAQVVHQLADELRYATLILEHSPHILEFVVADRNADGTAETFRYEWSGVAGEPLLKSMNGLAPESVVDSVNEFAATVVSNSKSTSLTTTADSAEVVLLSHATVQNNTAREITSQNYAAQQIDPAQFAAPIPANAINFNVTKADFYGYKAGSATDALVVEVRSAGDPNSAPTSHVLGQKTFAEGSLSSGPGWNTAVFAAPLRGLAFHQSYDLVWVGSGSGPAARLVTSDAVTSTTFNSDDGGTSWQSIENRQIFYRLYGTYTTPGPTYTVTRNYASNVNVLLRAGQHSHARVDANVPLANRPELLAAYWRSDFDIDPTATDANGDAAADWALAGGADFDPADLIAGVWHASGALETRPANNFLQVTCVHVRCRNTTAGGNGAVVRIDVDRHGGLYAPLVARVQRQADGTQILTLFGKTSDANTTKLFASPRLSSDFVEYRLTILPASNVVNLQIRGEDQGAFVYPTYAPTSANQFLTMFADSSLAEFDYIELRVATE